MFGWFLIVFGLCMILLGLAHLIVAQDAATIAAERQALLEMLYQPQPMSQKDPRC